MIKKKLISNAKKIDKFLIKYLKSQNQSSLIQPMKYGIISDVHHDPRIVPVTIDVLKKLGAEKLILNGDIGERQRSLQASWTILAARTKRWLDIDWPCGLA